MAVGASARGSLPRILHTLGSRSKVSDYAMLVGKVAVAIRSEVLTATEADLVVPHHGPEMQI